MGKGLSGIMGPIYFRELDSDNRMGPIYLRELDCDNRTGPIYFRELDSDNQTGPIYFRELDCDNWTGPIYVTELDSNDRTSPIYVRELDSYHKKKYNIRRRCTNGEKRHWVTFLFQCFSAIRLSNHSYNYSWQSWPRIEIHFVYSILQIYSIIKWAVVFWLSQLPTYHDFY